MLLRGTDLRARCPARHAPVISEPLAQNQPMFPPLADEPTMIPHRLFHEMRWLSGPQRKALLWLFHGESYNEDEQPIGMTLEELNEGTGLEQELEEARR